MEKREYFVISCKDINELIAEVNKALKSEWVPIGGVSFAPHPQMPLFMQAIVRQIS